MDAVPETLRFFFEGFSAEAYVEEGLERSPRVKNRKKNSEKRKKAKPFVTVCGECYRYFSGISANIQLQAHIKEDPCEHYARVSEKELIARAFQDFRSRAFAAK